MVQFNGKYEIIKNENFREYLLGVGLSEERAQAADIAKVVLEIIVEVNKITINFNSNMRNSSSVYIVGQAVDEKLATGECLKSTASIVGDKIIIKWVSPKGEKGTRSYIICDAGVTVVYETEGGRLPTATRTYKRL